MEIIYCVVLWTVVFCHHTWSQEANCKDPGVPQNGIRIGPSFEHGQSVTFLCNRGYTLIGNNTVVCRAGVWSSSLPQCKVVANCKDPGIPRNGTRTGDNFGHDQTVSFTCNNGNTLIGNKSMVCRNGVWSSSLPQCKINGGWGEWGHWSECSVTCGPGMRSRGRKCDSPKPENGGEPCNETERVEEEKCNKQNCPVNGGWGEWGHWSECSVTCGPGMRSRERKCESPKPEYGGEPCNKTERVEKEKCKKQNCPDCNDPGVPQNGIRIGPSFEHGQSVKFHCNTGYTLIGNNAMVCRNGVWSSSLPQCENVTNCKDPGIPRNGTRTGDNFGHGQTVSFTCNNGYTLIGSKSMVCRNGVWSSSLPQCKINGGWGEWGDWSECSVTCGPGMRSRERKCDSPKLENGGEPCNETERVEEEKCNKQNCPVNGGWGEWGHWSECNVTCGPGMRSRERKCESPKPEYGGEPCNKTEGVEEEKCKKQNCPANCKDPGVPQKGIRIGSSFEQGQSVKFLCNRNYTLIGSKSMVCRNGVWSSSLPQCKDVANCKDPGIPRNGTRTGDNFGHGQTVSFTCNNGYTLIGSKSMVCRNGVWSSSLPQCKINGGWGEWGDWSECSVTCGPGMRSRERKCDSPKPENGGKPCNETERVEEEKCNKQNCPVNGGWGEWGHWSECSVTCGPGMRSRERKCDSPKPENGGEPCNETGRVEVEKCNKKNCPVIDGDWGEWGCWSECSLTCGLGMRSRERKCDSPKPQNGGEPCNDAGRVQMRSCRIRKCGDGVYDGSSGSGYGWETYSGDGSEHGDSSGSSED